MRREIFLMVILLLVVSNPVGAQDPTGDSSILPRGAKVETVFEDGSVLTEGVAVAPDGMVYFSDITFTHASKDEQGVSQAGFIWRHDPRSGETKIFRSPS